MTRLSLIEVVSPLISALVASMLLTLLGRRRSVLLDTPNERSLHDAPIPRVGGLAVLPAIAAGWLCLPASIPAPIWGSAAFLFALSFLDDARDLHVAIRLSAHLLAGFVVTYALVAPTAGWLIAVVAAVAIAWMTNLYNFMDGSDGLAGGMAMIGFSVYAIAALVADAPALAQACLAIAAASAVFLRYNFHPARVFLGDAGSVPLGFLAAALGAQGWSAGIWPAWFPILVFSPFVVDASVTLLRRTLRGERIWQAHREHYYQRLVRLGWGHRRTAIAEYLLMLACAIAALYGIGLPPAAQLALLAACAAVQALLMVLVDRAWKRHEE